MQGQFKEPVVSNKISLELNRLVQAFRHLLEQKDALFYPTSLFGYFFLPGNAFYYSVVVCCMYKFQTLKLAILGDRNWYLANSFKLTKRIQGLHESTRKLEGLDG